MLRWHPSLTTYILLLSAVKARRMGMAKQHLLAYTIKLFTVIFIFILKIIFLTGYCRVRKKGNSHFYQHLQVFLEAIFRYCILCYGYLFISINQLRCQGKELTPI
jgi:hypothetical protein